MSVARRSVLSLALVLLSLVPSFAHAWPHGPSGSIVQSASALGRVASDGAGGTFVAFGTYSFTSSSYDVFVQHFDAKGQAQWPAPGTAVCSAPELQECQAILPDGYGGCVVAWNDYRNVGNGADLYAQRIGPAGDVLWPTPDGVVVAVAPGNQTGARMRVSGSYVWLVWQDARNAVTTGSDIYMQCIGLFSGVSSVAASGAVVCNAAGDQSSPDLEGTSYSEIYVAWADRRSGVDDIYAQKMTWNGLTSWTPSGYPVCTAVGTQGEPRVLAVPGPRVVVTWTDYRGSDQDIYAQSLTEFSGSPMWTANGVAVCAAAGQQYSAHLALDAASDVVVAWVDQRRGFLYGDVYSQKLNPAGEGQWNSSGVAVRTANGIASGLQVASDGLGGTYIAWQDSRVDISDVYAQRLNSWGGMLWAQNGAMVGSGPGSQAAISIVPTSGGGLFAVWDDYATNPWGVRLQKFDEWGYVGADPVLASVKDVPNDQGGQVKVSWYGSPLDTDPVYRNISDYIVFRSVPAPLAAQLARAAGANGTEVARDGKRYVRTRYAAQDYFWEEIAHVNPRHLAQYSYVASTEGDSISGSNRKTAFMVMAVANYGGAWWASNADSGYSVDNVAPAAPAPFTGAYGAGNTALHWNPNTESDLAGYRLYRGASAAFVPGPSSFVAELSDTGYTDAAPAPSFYKLTAVDIHGNESPVATLLPAGTLGVGDGAAPRAEFAAPAPNPMHGGRGATLRFALAAGGHAKLAVYDAQGRVVRVLADGAREAGEHAVAFDGRDAAGRALAPGLYLARISAPGLDATRRIVIVE